MRTRIQFVGMGFFLAVAAFTAVMLAMMASPLPALAVSGGQCIGLVRGGGGEHLVNRCGDCRMATVLRSRPGSGLPASRQFSLRAKSDLRLPFKGPGHSRVTADLPCKGSADEAPNLVSPRGTPRDANTKLDQQVVAPQAAAKCLSLTRTVSGGVAVNNSCAFCRVAGIHRQDISGQRTQREVLVLQGGATKLVPQKGFARIGLLGELECRKPS